jgi:hypothetical protein
MVAWANLMLANRTDEELRQVVRKLHLKGIPVRGDLRCLAAAL